MKYSSTLEEETRPEDIYRLRDDFLSPAEFSFYKVCLDLFKGHFVICPKVSLTDLFFVTNPQKNMSAYNRINRKHVDFVVCDAVRMLPLFAIELDDKSHQAEKRKERDRFVDTVFAQAELPLVHIPAQLTYNQNDLGVVFKQTLTRSTNYKKLLSEKKKTVADNTSNPYQNLTQPAEPKTEKQAPFCPKCGEPMVIREAKHGANQGRQFYGCTNYPKCRVVIPVEEG